MNNTLKQIKNKTSLLLTTCLNLHVKPLPMYQNPDPGIGKFLLVETSILGVGIRDPTIDSAYKESPVR